MAKVKAKVLRDCVIEGEDRKVDEVVEFDQKYLNLLTRGAKPKVEVIEEKDSESEPQDDKGKGKGKSNK